MAVKNNEYERAKLTITEFDSQDAIATSGEYAQDLYETRGIFDSNW